MVKSSSSGGMAEWTKAAVLKTAVGFIAHRGFESLSLRLGMVNLRGGARVADWGRLLSGCRGNSRPWVRIPPSPPFSKQ